MSDIAIRVENMSKMYRIGRARQRHDTLRDAVAATFKRFSVQTLERSNDVIWALKDVSFEVKRGEVVGVIGRNGAGKSTLLKILSRITEPTEGRAEIYGRVGSLLEVGTGFHPELTGRENIYLSGAILGMKRAEIDRRFDEIVAFSEVERFLDTPFKHYSSGMKVRLGFAVAAHLEPEILLVDEVLAVGDAAFQKKCLGKMGEVAGEGRTVLFVSHNMGAVSRLCRRVTLLESGSILADGSASGAVREYLSMVSERSGVSLADRRDRKGTGRLRFLSCDWLDTLGNAIDGVRAGSEVALHLLLRNTSSEHFSDVYLGVGIDTLLGSRVAHLSNYALGHCIPVPPREDRAVCFEFKRFPLMPGRYTLTLMARSRDGIEDWIVEAGSFEVHQDNFYGTGRLPPQGNGVFLASYTVTSQVESCTT